MKNGVVHDQQQRKTTHGGQRAYQPHPGGEGSHFRRYQSRALKVKELESAAWIH